MRNSQHELIPITKKGDSDQWVDARTLHRFLEVGKDFSTWIKDFIADFGFVEGRDFSPILGKSTGGRNAIEYTLTLDMAKELSMLQRSEKGKQARQYFIAAEKELRRLQTALLNGYDEVEVLLHNCKTVTHQNSLFYSAAQLRRLAGKSFSTSNRRKLEKLALENLAAKLPDGDQERWYVHENAVDRLLCVKVNSIVSVCMVKLLTHQKQGGTL